MVVEIPTAIAWKSSSMDPVGEVWADIPMCNLGAPGYGRNDPESYNANSG